MQYEALSTQTSAQMRQVLSAKITGGWMLHRLLSDLPLDLFVLFSSSSSLLSSPLMGGYSAANVFLDALAHHRRSLGLPAMSINWGTWAEAGMATRFHTTDDPKRQGRSGATKGIGTLSNRRAFEAWERLIDSGVPQAGVMPINWDQWQQAYGGLAASAYLSLLVKPPARDSADLDTARARRKSILHAAPELRREPIELYLAEQMSAILKVSLETIDADKSIAGLGFDSLMSIELKNKIEADLRVSVAMARLIQGPTLTELAGMIVELLNSAPADESSARSVAAEEEFEEGSL
jgi:acyl carrier protein